MNNDFIKYQHIERYGTENVEDINIGTCYVFPKIDGTNGSLFFDKENNIIKAGSRNRELTLEEDNRGFYKQFINDERFISFFKDHPGLRLYGEFLIPHSLKTYRDDAWRKFYIFDVVYDNLGYLNYDDYKPILEKYNLDYIPCMAKINNGSYDQFINILNQNNFLIKDGLGIGEGIVIKNYEYTNRFGRITWAKIVTSEFKEKNIREMGCPEVKGEKIIEKEIIEKYLTSALIEKVLAKITNEKGGWKSEYIPIWLGIVWYDFINEEIWNIIKEYKNPKIDFKLLNRFCVSKIKGYIL